MTTQALEVVDQPTGLIAEQDGWTAAKIELVRATVAPNATDDELQMFLALAQKYGLDVFAKELWCLAPMKDGQRAVDKYGNPKPAAIYAGRDGYLAIANRHPAYKGLVSDVVYQGDTFARTETGVQHAYNLEERKVKIVGAYALVYRSDRDHPAYFFARFDEYSKGQSEYSGWGKYPSAMITKVAEAVALRHAFSISGLAGEDERTPDDEGPRPALGEDEVSRARRASLSLPAVPDVGGDPQPPEDAAADTPDVPADPAGEPAAAAAATEGQLL